ncbi:MAG: glycerophosphodiester phosphodiesterase [Armatimonadota bacterium]
MIHTVSATAHRGYSAKAPENTLTAIRKALELHPEMIECDVRRTVDDSIVIIHDSTVDRTTNGTGNVGEMTFNDIRRLDAGSWFSPDFAGEKVPSLDETLDLCKDKIKLIIEIKEDGIDGDVVRAIQQKQMSEQVFITSFHHNIGVRLPVLDKSIHFIPLVWHADPAGDEESVRLATEAANVNGSVLSINYQAITPELVEAVHTANLKLQAWTVDHEDDMRRMVDLGVDMITSNQVKTLLRILSEMGVRP